VPHYEAEIILTCIDELSKDGARSAELGRDTARFAAFFSPLDLVEELSETTQLAYPTLIKLLSRLPSQDRFVRNPPRFLHEASCAINRIKIEEMVSTIDYRPTGEQFGCDLKGHHPYFQGTGAHARAWRL
jgi:type III restriction enzyme